MVTRRASRFFLLAAILWLGFIPSVFAIRSPDVPAASLSENRVEGSDLFASGRLGIEDEQSPENAMGLAGCGYETASGRLKWLNRDPIGVRGGINGYSFVKNSPTSRIDATGLDDADLAFYESLKPRPPKQKGFNSRVSFGPMTLADADTWTRYMSENEDMVEAVISVAVGFGCYRAGVPPIPSLGIGLATDVSMAGYDGPIFHQGDTLMFESAVTFDGTYDSGVVVEDARMIIYPSDFIGPIQEGGFVNTY